MLGRYQPWHEGHRKLFEKILQKTGQVLIMVRDVEGLDDNPFGFEEIERMISSDLQEYGNRSKVIRVPNITDICYGRDVGYNIEEVDLDSEIKDISASKIRKKLRFKGEL